MGRILIRDLALQCIIGTEADERRQRQPVLVSLSLTCGIACAAKNDDLVQAVDYREIERRLLALADESRFHLLEALAEAIADACLATRGVNEVQVIVDKPGALRSARSVGVEIVRLRA